MESVLPPSPLGRVGDSRPIIVVEDCPPVIVACGGKHRCVCGRRPSQSNDSATVMESPAGVDDKRPTCELHLARAGVHGCNALIIRHGRILHDVEVGVGTALSYVMAAG